MDFDVLGISVGDNITEEPSLVALSDRDLSRVPKGVAVPAYDRRALKVGIVHFGVGNFHRVHEAIAIDRCLNADDDRSWGICGVGLTTGPSAVAKAEAYRAQDGLYTVTTYAPDGTSSVRVVGAMIDYLLGPDNPEAVLRRLAAPDTRIVSLTITEGGYNIDEATGTFVLDRADVVHDLSGKPPRTAFGFIVEGLARRRAAGLEAFTVLSCDNLRHNGDTIKLAILSFARGRDADLAEWIESHATFPNSMVDRIAPEVSEADRVRLNGESGVDDALPAFCEDFTQWVLEDRFCAGRPALERAGVTFSDDVAGYEAAKGRMLNASHILLSYPGILAGYRYVDEALEDELLKQLLETFFDSDVIPIITGPAGVSLPAYRDKIIERYMNRAIHDQLLRIALDGASKIPVFHSKTIATLAKAGGDLRREAFLLACFARYLSGVDDLGNTFDVREPQLSAADRTLVRDGGAIAVLRIKQFASFDVLTNPSFMTWFEKLTASLEAHGTKATIRSLLFSDALAPS
ncbi:MAG: mannitol dehydrogenase family protein [Candidatus Eremiobacteraeota bacterium]|nr:mannitol dehydrogenase family protein [Candidatus Eremiobacteraeota bacterium]